MFALQFELPTSYFSCVQKGKEYFTLIKASGAYLKEDKRILRCEPYLHRVQFRSIIFFFFQKSINVQACFFASIAQYSLFGALALENLDLVNCEAVQWYLEKNSRQDGDGVSTEWKVAVEQQFIDR